MCAQIAADQGAEQQGGKPVPADFRQQAEGYGTGAIPEQPDQNHRIGNGLFELQPKPAHKPEGHHEAGARGERTVQYADSQQDDPTGQKPDGGAMAWAMLFSQAGVFPGIEPQADGHEPEGDLAEGFIDLQNQIGAQHYARQAAGEDEQREARA